MKRLGLGYGITQQGSKLNTFYSIMMIEEGKTSIGAISVIGNSFSIVGGNDASKFSINQSTGELSFVSAPFFDSPTDVNADGIYNVIVKGGNNEYNISVVVLHENLSTYKKFPIDGFYTYADNSYNTSSNWKTVIFSVNPGETISYRIYSVVQANAVTYFDANGDFVARIRASGQAPPLVQTDDVIVPDGVSYAAISTYAENVSDSNYKLSEHDRLTWNYKILRTLTVNPLQPEEGLNYTTITGALAASQWGDLIEIVEGTYTEYSLYIPNGVQLKGIGTVIINGELPASAETSLVDATSTIDLNNTGKLGNLTITAKNMRYPIHNDSSAGDAIQIFENCKFIHYGNYELWQYRTDNLLTTPNAPSEVFRAVSAFGAGTRSGDIKILRNCYLESKLRAFSTHNFVDFSEPSLVVVENCQAISHGIDFDNSEVGFNVPYYVQNLESTKNDIVVIKESMGGNFIGHDEELTHTIIHDISNLKTIYNSCGGSKLMKDLIAYVNPTKYSISIKEENNYKNVGSVVIPRGSAVKANGTGVELMTSSDFAGDYFGIALQQISADGYGDVRKKGKGYLLRPYLAGLSSVVLTEGDQIGVQANGSFAVRSGVIIATAADNQNVDI